MCLPAQSKPPMSSLVKTMSKNLDFAWIVAKNSRRQSKDFPEVSLVLQMIWEIIASPESFADCQLSLK